MCDGKLILHFKISSISIADIRDGGHGIKALHEMQSPFWYIFAVITAAVKMAKRVSRRVRDKYQNVYRVK